MVLSIIVAAFLWGYHSGSASEKEAVATAAAKQDQKTIIVTQKQTVVDTTAVTALQKQLDSEKGVNAKLQSQVASLSVQQLTTVTPATSTVPESCDLSSNWTSVYNASLQPSVSKP